jgi:hypothetical protein
MLCCCAGDVEDGAWCARSESRDATESPNEPTAALSLLKHTHIYSGRATPTVYWGTALSLWVCVCVYRSTI